MDMTEIYASENLNPHAPNSRAMTLLEKDISYIVLSLAEVIATDYVVCHCIPPRPSDVMERGCRSHKPYQQHSKQQPFRMNVPFPSQITEEEAHSFFINLESWLYATKNMTIVSDVFDVFDAASRYAFRKVEQTALETGRVNVAALGTAWFNFVRHEHLHYFGAYKIDTIRSTMFQTPNWWTPEIVRFIAEIVAFAYSDFICGAVYDPQKRWNEERGEERDINTYPKFVIYPEDHCDWFTDYMQPVLYRWVSQRILETGYKTRDNLLKVRLTLNNTFGPHRHQDEFIKDVFRVEFTCLQKLKWLADRRILPTEIVPCAPIANSAWLTLEWIKRNQNEDFELKKRVEYDEDERGNINSPGYPRGYLKPPQYSSRDIENLPFSQ